MTSDEFDWKSGVIEYWDLQDLDESKPLIAQADHLKEDLAQVSYPSELCLDIGWYGSSPDGKFAIVVTRDGDWDCPIFRSEAADIPSLKLQISKALMYLMNLT